MRKLNKLVLLSLIIVLVAMVFVACDIFKGSQGGNKDGVTFTITFDTQGGSEVKPITIAEGATITLPSNPTKEGYIFDGWYLSDEFIEKFNATQTISSDITVYAKWKEINSEDEYSVIFNLNYGTDNIVEKTTENHLITYVPVRAGFKFNGWYYSDGYVEDVGYVLTEKYDVSVPVSQNGLILYAEWVDASTDSRQLASPTISCNGTFLSWNAIQGAEKYELKFYLGKNHIKTYNTTNTSVNIDQIGIDAGTYTLKARSIGDGISHINSVETTKYISYKVLLPVSGAQIDVETSILSWSEANNARTYTIYIDDVEYGSTYSNSYDLSKLNAGQYIIKIVASRQGYTSSNATFTLVKSRLLTPTIKIERQPNDNYSSKISWSAIYNANQYVVVVDKKEVATTSNNYYVLNDSDWGSNKKVSVSVYAKDSSADYLVSIPSEISTVTRTAKIAISHNIRKVSLVKVIGKSYSSTDNLIENYSSADNFYVGVDFGEPKKVVAIPQNGYTWLGWYDKSGNLISTKTEYIFDVNTSSSEIVAHWASYSVALNKNDNNAGKIGFSVDDMSTQNTVSQRIVYGKEVTICASTNNGYTWLGWYKGDEKVSNEQTYTFTMSDSDLAFTAKWSKTTISVSSSSAGSVSGLSSTYKVGDKVTITAVTNTGYTWDGWYLNGEKVSSDLQYEIQITEEPLNYVATWKYYTLTTSRNISAAGTVNSYWNQKVTVGDSVELVANTNKGYTWLGWYDGETLISSETTFTYEMPAESKTLIAKWTYYTLSTQTNDSEAGTYTDLSDKKVTVGDSIELIASTNDGYTWLGWYDGETLLSSETTFTYVMTAESKTMTAKWEIITYSITYSYTYETEFETLLRTSYTHKDSNIVLEMPNNGTYYVDYWYYFGEADTRITEIDTGTMRDLVVVGHVASCGLSLSESSIVGIGTCTQTELLFPRYNGKTEITQISENAFKDKSSITNAMIPDSVTSIGERAFSGCTGLTSVTIPDSVTSIGSDAFKSCIGLTSITIPDSVTSIGESAFSGCTGLTSVTIGGSVTSIGKYTFYGCNGLTTVTIPDSVTSIGSDAFKSCNNLQDIYITDIAAWCNISGLYELMDVNSNNKNLYINNELATSITIPNGVKAIPSCAFRYCAGLTSITIPDSVTSIGSYAFYNCTRLTSITIPDSVTSIDIWAFRYCSGLTSITISDSVTTIGAGAFENCYNLQNIYITDIAAWCNIAGLDNLMGYGFIGYGSSNKKLYINNELVTSVTIPDGVTSIPSDAFSYCSGLTSVTIPDSVTSIGYEAFGDTAWYNNQPDGLVYAGKVAYKYKGTMPSNTAIVLKEGTLSITASAFNGCSGLTSITIPDSVTSIGYRAFRDCTGLTTVNWNATECTSVGSSYLEGCSNLATVNIGDNVTIIPSSAFRSCSSLTSITIPNGVTSIGEDAFEYCSGLSSITIPDSVTSIGERAFYKTAWYNNQPNGLVYAGKVAYEYKGAMPRNTSIVLKEGTLSITDSAFYDHTNLTSITIPDSVTSIGAWAFWRCRGLTSITISDSVTSIGEGAFTYCDNLQNIYITDIAAWCNVSGLDNLMNVNSNNKNLYINNELATSITIPNGVKAIPSCAFRYCTGLTSVTIGNSVTSIGKSAFYGCTGLTSVIFKDTPSWYRTNNINNWNNKSGGTLTGVTSATTNATYFKDTYRDYYWYKL